MTPKTKRIIIFVAAFWCVVLVIYFMGKRQEELEAADFTSSYLDNPPKPSVPAVPSAWKFDSSVDEMTSEMTYRVWTQLTNTITLYHTPDASTTRYRVKTRDLPSFISRRQAVKISKKVDADVTFNVTKNAGNGAKTIYFKATEGQFDISDGKIRMRFDEQEPIFVDVIDAKDDPRKFLLADPKPIIAALLKTKQVLVEVGFVGEGVKVLKYNVEGFK